jgi:ribosomal RNA-processing protein 9
VTCLAFRDDAHARLGGGDDDGLGGGDASSQLFSGGDDGSVKHWGAKAGAYVETLFGHEAPVAALDCAYEEKPLSGGRDRTARCWKIRDESHLVYRSPTAGGLGSSVDACRVLDKDRFLTGGDDGALSLWSARRKKPVVSVKRAHGAGAAAQALGESARDDVSAHVPRWLQSVAAPRHSDVVASGSCDGAVRLWTVDDKDAAKQVLEPFAALPQLGFVNGLAAPRDAAFLAAAVAKEPRLGRWEKVAKAKNCVVLYPLLNSGSAL